MPGVMSSTQIGWLDASFASNADLFFNTQFHLLPNNGKIEAKVKAPN